MNQIFPPPASFSMPPGCPPASCFDPAALLGCYNDIQALTALISQIVTGLAANDPAFQQSLVEAIAKSGSNIPLVGVTNGSNAQPGQVGEWVEMTGSINYASGVSQQPLGTITLGVLQPGDWDCFAFMETANPMEAASFILTTTTGFSNAMNGFLFAGAGAPTSWGVIDSPTARCSISVPTLVVFTVNVYGTTAAGNANLVFDARRAR